MNVWSLKLCQFSYRGGDFRPTYLRVAELRSLFAVPVLATSATVNPTIYSDICKILHISDFSIIARLPDRPNIFLKIDHSSSLDLDETFSHLALDIKAQGTHYPKTIIFTETGSSVVEIYNTLLDVLGDSNSHLLCMFHAKIGSTLRDFVMSTFPKESSDLRVIVCTIAFGMGIQINDIRQVFQWGRCASMLAFWQKVGRTGRDGRPATACWFASGVGGRDIELFKEMKKDRENCI
jgi:superfamily II DNA helicase RecQ